MTPCPKPYREKLTKAQFKRRAVEIFIRDGHICQYCGRIYPEFIGSLHAHHRVFKSQGGDDQHDNLASCCWECHADHGALKNAKLKTEMTDAKICELVKRYSI